MTLTSAEYAVLHGADSHPDQAYQPPPELLAAANALLERGLIQKAADFPDVIVLTQPEGEAAYLAGREKRTRD